MFRLTTLTMSCDCATSEEIAAFGLARLISGIWLPLVCRHQNHGSVSVARRPSEPRLTGHCGTGRTGNSCFDPGSDDRVPDRSSVGAFTAGRGGKLRFTEVNTGYDRLGLS